MIMSKFSIFFLFIRSFHSFFSFSFLFFSPHFISFFIYVCTFFPALLSSPLLSPPSTSFSLFSSHLISFLRSYHPSLFVPFPSFPFPSLPLSHPSYSSIQSQLFFSNILQCRTPTLSRQSIPRLKNLRLFLQQPL
jgi:hypothetical protein